MICIYCGHELGLNQEYYHKCKAMEKVGASSPLAMTGQSGERHQHFPEVQASVFMGRETPPSWVKAAFPGDFHQIVHENEKPTTPCPSSREIIPLKRMDPDVAEILGRIIEEADLKVDQALAGTFEYDYKLIVSSLIQYRNDLESLVDAVRDCGLAVSRGEEIRKRRSWP